MKSLRPETSGFRNEFEIEKSIWRFDEIFGDFRTPQGQVFRRPEDNAAAKQKHKEK